MKNQNKKSKPYSSSNKEQQVRDGFRKRKLRPMPKEKFKWQLVEED